jgi:hypothetical protein
MFVPDLLHEFELGVWKAIFIHLLRVLIAAGGDRIQQLNERFRQVPTFGRDTIRRFAKNTADLKKLAARNFEDILQCCIPVFEGLLDEPYNGFILDLLWVLTTWHARAKLRLHTTSTMAFLENTTTALGRSLRHFKEHVCSQYITRELPRETAARGRRTAALASSATTGQGHGRGRGKGRGRGHGRAEIDGTRSTDDLGTTPDVLTNSGPRTKSFNLTTYKLHALGDYVTMIKQFGTTDNTSTQTVCM